MQCLSLSQTGQLKWNLEQNFIVREVKDKVEEKHCKKDNRSSEENEKKCK